MTRLLGLLLLSASSMTCAFAQTQSQTPASAAASVAAARDIKPGTYAGTLQQKDGSGSANVKMTIRDVTADGRVTARVESSHARASCAKSLPVNGIVLPEGEMRLTVDDGAPEGCERVYFVKVSGSGVSGNFIEGKGPAKSVKR